MKYIDAEKLKKIVEQAKQRALKGIEVDEDLYCDGRADAFEEVLLEITSLQQDETQVDKMLCSQIWWEEQGWIMIPPDATIEGIDSLLKQVRKRLQQEQPYLPDNLDEAAQKVEDYYDVGEEHGYLNCHRGDIKDVFKVGAEWMAEQGLKSRKEE